MLSMEISLMKRNLTTSVEGSTLRLSDTFSPVVEASSFSQVSQLGSLLVILCIYEVGRFPHIQLAIPYLT
jgi:hypothetical protein